MFKKPNRVSPEVDIAQVITTIKKAHGGESIMQLGQNMALCSVECIPTQSPPIDCATGIGGLPRGRIIEIYGPESSSKTTQALRMLAGVQAYGEHVAFIDAEHALDPSWARSQGVDTNTMFLSQPDSGEQALQIVESLASTFGLIVIDSVPALVPQAELEGDLGDHHIALQARLLGQFFRRATAVIKKSGCILVFINQLRDKMGPMMPGQSPTQTPGGRALKFWASIRLECKRVAMLKQGETTVGGEFVIKTVKNKVAPPFVEHKFWIAFRDEHGLRRGLIDEMAVLQYGAECKLIDKSGAWFNYGITRLGNGAIQASAFLQSNPDMAFELYQRIVEIKNPIIANGQTPVEAAVAGIQEDDAILNEIDQLERPLSAKTKK